MNIDFEGINKNDPVSLTTALRKAFDSIEAQAQAATPPAAAAVQGDFPRFDNAKAMTLRYQGGTYGGSEDPRVAFVANYSGSGLSRDKARQRFRFERGTSIMPLIIAPVDKHNWSHSDIADAYTFDATTPVFRQLSCGIFVVGIPHDLGRVPERVTFRGSAGPFGPTGQRLEVMGGSFFGGAGKPVRAEIDFLPVLGYRALDIERRLKMLVGFSASGATASEHGFDDNAGMATLSTNFSNPDLLRQYSSEMVTTDRVFSGLLIATVWGIPTWQQTVGWSTSPNVTGFERMTGMVRDPVTGRMDPMCSAILPEIGKSIWSGAAQSGNSLQQYFAAGVKLALVEGTVDFVLE